MKYDISASQEVIKRAMEALKACKYNVELVTTKEDTLRKIKNWVSDGNHYIKPD